MGKVKKEKRQIKCKDCKLSWRFINRANDFEFVCCQKLNSVCHIYEEFGKRKSIFTFADLSEGCFEGKEKFISKVKRWVKRK